MKEGKTRQDLLVAFVSQFGYKILGFAQLRVDLHRYRVAKAPVDDAGRLRCEVERAVDDLIAWAEKSMELKPEQRDEVVKKLKYGQLSPQKEYDTVITHVLVWLFEWGYPIANTSPTRKPVVNALYEEVEKAVRAALDEREKEAPRTLLKESIEKRRKAMGYDD